MEKKLVFKKWVEYLLIIISLLAFFILGADSEDLKFFIVSKLICITIIGVNTELLLKYGRSVN